MPWAVHQKTKTAVLDEYSFFKQDEDCTGKCYSSANQKIEAAVLLLSHGVAPLFFTTKIWLLESLILFDRQCFVLAMVKNFWVEYLCWPNVQCLGLLIERYAKLGFLGVLGSLDCAGWKLHKGAVMNQWRNIVKEGAPVLRLECVKKDRLGN